MCLAESLESEKEVRAKLFLNGRSQAVRLPKEFRLEGSEVRVKRVGKGVLLEPAEVAQTSWNSLEELYARFSPSDRIFPEGREQPEMQERDWTGFE